MKTKAHAHTHTHVKHYPQRSAVLCPCLPDTMLSISLVQDLSASVPDN